MRTPTRARIAAVIVAAAAAVSVAGCSGHHGGQPLKITTYHGADWVTDGTATPPISPDRGDRIHYPHTMNGAVEAATDSQTLLDTAGNDGFGAVARDYYTVGPGMTAYLAARANISITGRPDPSRLPHITGFRFLAYTPDTATVEILFTQPDHSINGLTRNLVWLGDNWLIQLPDPKDTTPVLEAYPNLPGDIEHLPQT